MRKNMRYKIRDARYENGSALILAVVLTCLLAIVGVLFVMTARVDKIATSAISEHRELDLAIDAVIARIAQELALDVPGDPCRLDEEYYDYPDLANRWLASLEPYEVGPGAYRWLYLTDLYDVIYNMFPQRRRIDMPVDIAPDYQDPAYVGDNSGSSLKAADADGDGVADSIWAEMPDITSGKGRTIYAAVRVIDNSAMINVNTAYKFDPTEGLQRIDGSSQMQINLMGLASRPDKPYTQADETALLEARAGLGDPLMYESNVVWRYNEPNGPYTPFDISDELELRYRFLLNHPDIDTRLESWGGQWRPIHGLYTPVTEPSKLNEWYIRAYADTEEDPNLSYYSYRHIGTTYNMDRIIRPDGGKMVNVNMTDRDALRNRITTALLDANPVFVEVSAAAAQIAANLIDFRDDDEIVTSVNDVDGLPYYGFERPCIYISELAYNFTSVDDVNHISYAIELYKPYFEDEDPYGWRLVINNSVSGVNDVNVPIIWSGTRRFHVIKWEDPGASLWVSFSEPDGPNPVSGARWVNPMVELGWAEKDRAASYNLYLGSGASDVNLIASDLNDTSFDITEYAEYDPNGLKPETVYHWRVDDVNGADTWEGEDWWFETGPADYNYSDPNFQTPVGWSPGTPVFDTGSIIELRRVAENGVPVVVDSIQVPDWLVAGAGIHSFQRDITRHKCIRRLWDPDAKTPTLYDDNIFVDPNMIMIQAHPYLDPGVYGTEGFRNIGEIGMVFRGNAYTPQLGVYPPDIIGYNDEIEEDVRINLADPNYQQLFNYLTVFDPTVDGIDNNGDGYGLGVTVDPNELKVPGRININTAPWYVIAQLPWMTPEIAQAIVYYRHTPQGPFESIGELNNVVGMDLYATDGERNGFPDLTPEDEAADDFEERDLIFARISNLVTVRSDVFTAYILVRIGPDGPQKRVIAILDRSDVYADGTGGVTGRVRVRALHPVPDPR